MIQQRDRFGTGYGQIEFGQGHIHTLGLCIVGVYILGVCIVGVYIVGIGMVRTGVLGFLDFSFLIGFLLNFLID